MNRHDEDDALVIRIPGHLLRELLRVAPALLLELRVVGLRLVVGQSWLLQHVR